MAAERGQVPRRVWPRGAAVCRSVSQPQTTAHPTRAAPSLTNGCCGYHRVGPPLQHACCCRRQRIHGEGGGEHAGAGGKHAGRDAEEEQQGVGHRGTVPPRHGPAANQIGESRPATGGLGGYRQLIRGQTGDHKRRGAGKSGAQSRERAASPIQPGLCGGRCQAQCCFQQVEASQLACA